MTDSNCNTLDEARRHLAESVDADYHKVICPFLREHGQFFDPQPLPKGSRAGKIAVCFADSYRLLKRHGKRLGLAYAEGFAVSAHVMHAHLHAWCLDRGGTVFDSTWKEGRAYFGIAFETQCVMNEIRRRKANGDLYFGFLDDWKHGHPRIKQLGDCPDVWKQKWKDHEE